MDGERFNGQCTVCSMPLGMCRCGETARLEAQLAEAHATIAALRAMVEDVEYVHGDADGASVCRWCYAWGGHPHEPGCEWKAALAQPIPPGATRLLALSALLEDRAWWVDQVTDIRHGYGYYGVADKLLAAINARLEEGA